MDKFKKQIKNYVSYDDKIKRYNLELRKLRQEKSRLEQSIIKFMNKNQMNDTIIKLTGGGKLEIGQSKRTESLSKNYILEKLTLYLGSEDDAKKIVDYLYSNRVVTMKDSIKRKNK
jgi:hypothetical protein